jgi:hypothetical protein
MGFYDHLNNSEDKVLAQYLMESYIPLWQQNLALTQLTRQEAEWSLEIDQLMENLEIYCEKRLEMGQSFLRSYKNGDDQFFGEIDFIQSEIDSLLKVLEN